MSGYSNILFLNYKIMSLFSNQLWFQLSSLSFLFIDMFELIV